MVQEIAPRENRVALGVATMALGVIFFTMIDTSAKWLIQSGLPVLQVVFVRYAVHFILSLVMFLPTAGPSMLHSNAPGKQFLRALFLFGSTILNFMALRYLPITVTTTIMFAGPIVVTFLAIPLLGEQVGIRRILAVCTGFLGVLVVIQPWGIDFHPAVFFSLGALTSASLYFVITRMLAGVESNATSQVWASGLATLCLAPFALPVFLWPQPGTQTAVFLLIGVFGALGHIAATSAHRLADASILAPVVYIQILLAAIAGILVFDTYPTVWTLGGGLIIIASGIYIWHRERTKSRHKRGAR
jgi:drug/metabolite transporter (DMT)-like permease